ncbi:hypothetical protein chiPu_0020262 [Chiloscyllium punctatum]|uniref:DNA helicase n=1 Tax=Chiloscyllium punctatum TaxID=137246 RepID=A0A401RUH5_CHIPU|nr:hypothetical protein [Chiloscyllium punctatum]
MRHLANLTTPHHNQSDRANRQLPSERRRRLLPRTRSPFGSAKGNISNPVDMADWHAHFQNEDEEDPEEAEDNEEDIRYAGRDSLIFLIDASEAMFEMNNEDTSAFDMTIQCVHRVYTSKIISSERDLLAVVFFGTQKHKNSVDFKHVYVLHDLDTPGAKRVLELDQFEGEKGKRSFKDQIGHSTDGSLADALWVCSNLFSDVRLKLSHKRIMLFTNNDNPHAKDSSKARMARTKASDLRETGGWAIITIKHRYLFVSNWAKELQQIVLEKEEIEELMRFDAPGLVLIGFKPLSLLKKHHYIRTSQFIYPEETMITGSSTLFSALLTKCLEKEVFAVARYIPRRNTPPRFVALVPQGEQLDDEQVQTIPPGFHLMFLPYADDKRKVDFTEKTVANEDQTEKMKQVVQKLRFKYRSVLVLDS